MTKRNGSLSRKNIRQIAVLGILSAITALMVFTPLGMIPVTSTISATTCLLPCLVGLLVEGPLVGGILGLVFGLLSMLRGFIAPISVMDPMFQNPLVSVLPRVLVPLFAWLIYKLAAGKSTNSKEKYIGYTLAAIAGSIVNTFVVLLMVALFNGALIMADYSGAVQPYLAKNAYTILLWLVAVPNGIPEAILSALAVPPIVVAVSSVKKRFN